MAIGFEGLAEKYENDPKVRKRAAQILAEKASKLLRKDPEDYQRAKVA